MTVSYSGLKRVAFFCLMLPTVFFAVGFLKWYIGIPVAALVAVAYAFTIRDSVAEECLESDGENRITLPTGALIATGVLAVVWCYLSGIGNLYYQSDDWSARNAVFRDLISHDWPVVYEIKDSALVYYIGFWLPPAALGKLVLAATGELETAFLVGNMALWVYSSFSLALAVLATAVFVRADSPRRIALLFAVAVLFSGLDIVGSLFNRIVRGTEIGNHIEWWSPYQISSLATCLGWVFNQAVPSWLATACFICERRMRSYAFILVLSAASSPFACVGLGIYMAGVGAASLVRAVKGGRTGELLREVFTVQNIILALAVLPIYLLYYTTNLAVSQSQGTIDLNRRADLLTVIFLVGAFCFFIGLFFRGKAKNRGRRELLIIVALNACLIVAAVFNREINLYYLSAVFLEGGIYLALIWRQNRREPLFYLTLLVLLICPLIRVGTSVDFCMRASIPAVFVLMALCVRFLLAKKEGSENERIVGRALGFALAVLLAVGAVTPYKEFKRGFDTVIEEGKLILVNDTVGSFDQIFDGDRTGLDRNFIATDYKSTVFFKYFAR